MVTTLGQSWKLYYNSSYYIYYITIKLRLGNLIAVWLPHALYCKGVCSRAVVLFAKKKVGK